jgi:hypothetical protein
MVGNTYVLHWKEWTELWTFVEKIIAMLINFDLCKSIKEYKNEYGKLNSTEGRKD